MKKRIIGMIIVIMEGAAYAADPAVVASKPNPSSLKSPDVFKISYYLKNSRGTRIMSPSGSVSLYSYSDPSCSNQLQQVGSSLDLSVGTIGSYSISSSGTYYLKPTLTGYVGNCVGPLTVLGTTYVGSDGTSQPLVFQKLSLSKSPSSSGNVNISLSWLNDSDLLVTTSTSSNKATFFLSQSQSCSSRISGSRLPSYSPKFGQASFSTSLPNVTPVFGCAYAYSGQTKITAQSIELKSCQAGKTLVSGICVSSTKSCESNNGSGTSTLDLSTMTWGSCILSSCSSGYHLVAEIGSCVSNVENNCDQNALISSRIFSNGAWGNCVSTQCKEGFLLKEGETTCSKNNFTKIAVGATHVCGITTQKTLKCWGNNQYGQLGIGNSSISSTPTPTLVPDITDVKDVVASGLNTCIIKGTTNSVFCWGFNHVGIGDGTLNNTRFSPVQVLNPDFTAFSGASSLAIGSYHFCSIKTDGNLFCWGKNGEGELGDGTSANRLYPVQVASSEKFSYVFADRFGTCATVQSSMNIHGSVRCWGLGLYGNGLVPIIDYPTGTIRNRRSANSSIYIDHKSVSSITSSGNGFRCAVSSGQIICWGKSAHNQNSIRSILMGGYNPGYCSDLGLAFDCKYPRKVYLLTNQAVKDVSVSTHLNVGGLNDITTACIASTTNEVYCLGSGAYGALGNGYYTLDFNYTQTTPVAIGITNAAAVKMGRLFGCALLTDGEIKCWGSNLFGQLGTGNYTDSPVPVFVSE